MRLIHYKTRMGGRMAVAGEPGRIYTQLVYIDSPMRLKKVPNGNVQRYGRDVDAPLKKACRTMLSAGKRLGITKGAKKHLRAAL